MLTYLPRKWHLSDNTPKFTNLFYKNIFWNKGVHGNKQFTNMSVCKLQFATLAKRSSSDWKFVLTFWWFDWGLTVLFMSSDSLELDTELMKCSDGIWGTNIKLLFLVITWVWGIYSMVICLLGLAATLLQTILIRAFFS